MKAEDWIAVYGAILASALAIIQIQQWRKSQELIAIRLSAEFNFSDSSRIELTITNISQIPLYIDFIGIGLCFRTWLKPWKLQHGDVNCLRLTSEREYVARQAEGVLKPGEMWDLWFHENDKKALDIKPSRWVAFGHRPLLMIDHSSDNLGIKKALKWKWSN